MNRLPAFDPARLRLFVASTLGAVCLLVPGPAACSAYEHFLRGLQLVQEGDQEAAVGEFLLARQEDPESVEIAMELARSLLSLHRHGEALTPARDAARRAPDRAEAHWLLGQVLLMGPAFHEALPHLRRAVEIEPQVHGYRMAYLLALESQNRFAEALDLLLPDRGGVEPETPYLMTRRGGLRIRVGQTQEAIEDFLEALEMSPSYPGAIAHLLSACWQMGPSPKTAEACRRGLEIVPDDPDLLRARSRILILLDRAEEALPELERLIEVDPADARVPMQLGIVRFEQDRLNEAIDYFRRARRIDPHMPDSDVWMWRALSRADSVAAALELAEAMVEKHPESTKARWILASSLARADRTNEALEELERVREIDPRHREAGILGALLLLESGDPEGARVRLTDLLERLPADREVLFHLAVLEERNDRTEEALAHFRVLLNLNPDDAEALNHAAYMCAEREVELEDALVWIVRAVELEPTNAAYLDSYGWVLYKLGRYAEAVVLLERAAHLQPDETEILLHLAQAYRETGQASEGRRILHNLMESSEKDPQIEALLRSWDRDEAEGGNRP